MIRKDSPEHAGSPRQPRRRVPRNKIKAGELETIFRFRISQDKGTGKTDLVDFPETSESKKVPKVSKLFLGIWNHQNFGGLELHLEGHTFFSRQNGSVRADACSL